MSSINNTNPNLPPISAPFPDITNTNSQGSSTSATQKSSSSTVDSTSSATLSTQQGASVDSGISLPSPDSADSGNVNWGKFLTLIWSAIQNQQQQTYQEELPTAQQKGMHEYAAAEAAAMAQNLSNIDQYENQIQTVQSAQNSENQFISNMNTKMQDITKTMNNAIDEHNAGKMNDTDFQAAVNSYNQQSQSLISQYQQQSSGFNNENANTNSIINQLNQQIGTYGIENFNNFPNLPDTLDFPTVTADTTTSISATLLQSLTNTFPSANQLTQNTINNQINNFISSMQMITQLQNSSEAAQQQRVDMLKLIFPVVALPQTLGLASASASVTSLGSPQVLSALNDSVYYSSLQQAGVKNASVYAGQLQYLSLLEMAQGSLYSVLGTNPNQGDSQAVKTNTSVNFADYISKFVNSSALDNIMQNIAQENGLSASQTAALKATFSQSLLSISVSNLAQNTGMYGLPTQLLGNISGFTPPTASSGPIDLNAILSNPQESKNLQDQLTNLISQTSGSSSSTAQIQAGNVLSALQSQGNSSPENIHNALSQQFSSNFDASTATTLTNQFLALLLNSQLNTELQTNPFYLSNTFMEGSQHLQAIANQSPFSTNDIDRSQFVSSLALVLENNNSNLSASDATIDANAVWTKVSANQQSFSNLNDFTNFLASAINGATGTDQTTSLNIAQSVNLGTGNVPITPLQNPGQTDVLPQEDLATAFKSQLRQFYTTHGVSPSQAESLSETATNEIITSPNSTLNVMKKVNAQYLQAGITNSNELWVQTYRNNLATSTKLSAFMAATTVNPLLYSQLVTMTGGTQGGKLQLPIQG